MADQKMVETGTAALAHQLRLGRELAELVRPQCHSDHKDVSFEVCDEEICVKAREILEGSVDGDRKARRA
jgi:hypothetical protein